MIAKPNRIVPRFQQETPFNFNPVTGAPILTLHDEMRDVNGIYFRRVFPTALWRYNPWTGDLRSLDDTLSDPTGLLILPPNEELLATPKVYDLSNPSIAETFGPLPTAPDTAPSESPPPEKTSNEATTDKVVALVPKTGRPPRHGALPTEYKADLLQWIDKLRALVEQDRIGCFAATAITLPPEGEPVPVEFQDGRIETYLLSPSRWNLMAAIRLLDDRVTGDNLTPLIRPQSK